MRRMPLGLPASGKVYTWLPWPTQRAPRPETLASTKDETAWQLCSVRGPGEAVAGAVEMFQQV
eukprot:1161138-Pelagomonas_calceolata.AAC.1